MTSLMQRIYSQLPPVLRSLVGTGYGYYVRRWRYGSNFEHLVETALARDSWNSQEWQHWQEEQLSRLLQRAMRNVPFYRHYWESQPNRDWRVLANWPILEKEQLRCAAGQFLANDCSARRLFQDYTSGTTGTPLRFLASRDTLRRWYALFEARSRRWYGVSRQNRWAILGGKLVKPVHEQNPPFWIWNCALNQLYMSCYHLSPSHISQYLDALKTYRIQYLYGYSSALYELALEVVRQGRIDLQMTVSITNAEPLLPAQREMIARAFSAPVRETYGMAEMCGAASECEQGKLHLWPEAGILEVLNGDQPVKSGEIGDLVFTGLINVDMPLIRYRVGDRGAMSTAGICRCGRMLPVLASIEGRCDDVLFSTRGERVGRLDPVFKAGFPIKAAQIIQVSLRDIHVILVPAPGFASCHAAEIARQLRARLGDVRVTFNEATEVPRTSTGKFRAVICRIPEEQRRELASST